MPKNDSTPQTKALDKPAPRRLLFSIGMVPVAKEAILLYRDSKPLTEEEIAEDVKILAKQQAEWVKRYFLPLVQKMTPAQRREAGGLKPFRQKAELDAQLKKSGHPVTKWTPERQQELQSEYDQRMAIAPTDKALSRRIILDLRKKYQTTKIRRYLKAI